MTEDPGSRPKLRRIKGKHWLGGVCAGMGYWLRVPTWLLRLGWTVLLLVYGIGGIVYVLLWIYKTRWATVPADYEERAGG